MLYWMHEMQHLALAPTRFAADVMSQALRNPFNPFTHTSLAKNLISAASVFEQVTRRHKKPEWNLDATVIDGAPVPVSTEVAYHRTWGDLIHFRRDLDKPRKDPKLLIVAPMSGHYATLLRGTVAEMLPDHEVYITDWRDARQVPVAADRFTLADYVDHIIDYLHAIGPNTHVLAVCQPAVPVFAATAVMSQWRDSCTPSSLTMIGGPIDTRENPTAVNKLAEEHPISWFEENVIATVPPPYPGMFRKVYPGFIQLTNFVSMNLDKHMASLGSLFDHLVEGDEEAAGEKRAFYDEYLAVMDLPADFYLQTVETVFQKHKLPKGEMKIRSHAVLPHEITNTAMLCIEGELDDICGVGQTKAALKLTTGLDNERKSYYLQKGAGHYGVFNGGKFRREIAPRIKAFIRENDLQIGTKRRKLVAVQGGRKAA